MSLHLVGRAEEPASRPRPRRKAPKPDLVFDAFTEIAGAVGPAYRLGTTLDPDNLHRAREIEGHQIDRDRDECEHLPVEEHQAHLNRCVINRYDAAVLALDLLPTLMRRASDLIRAQSEGSRRRDLDHDLTDIARMLAAAAQAIDGGEPEANTPARRTR